MFSGGVKVEHCRKMDYTFASGANIIEYDDWRD